MTTEATEQTTIEAPPPAVVGDEAPPPPTEPAPPETPEQAAARDVSERKAARIARATASEKAAAEARETRRAKRAHETAHAERQRLANERQAWERQQQERAEAIRRGGIAALKAQTGLEYSKLTLDWIDQSTPEGKERARIAQLLEQQQRTIQELSQSQQQQKIEQAFTALNTTLETHADKYPHAYAMSSRMFRAAVPAIAQALINQGRQPTESLVLKMLDDAEKNEHDERETRRSALQKRLGTKPGNGQTQASRSTANGAVRTLTSQDGSERARSAGPKTAAELDEEIARVIAPMLKDT